MDAIVGITLASVVTDVEHELLEESRNKVKEQIRGYYIAQRDVTRELARLRKEVKDKEEKLAKIEQKITLVKAENWVALQSDAKPNQEKNKTEDSQ